MFNMFRFVEYHVLQVDNFEQKQPKHMGCIWYLTTRDTFRPPVRITECGHSYCEACLLQIRGPHTLAVRQQRLAFHGQNFTASQSYSCPECRKPQFKEVEDLTRNYFAERAVENFTSTKIKEPKDDEMCKLHNMPLILSEFRWSLDVKTIPYSLYGIVDIPWYIISIWNYFKYVPSTRKGFAMNVTSIRRALGKKNAMFSKLKSFKLWLLRLVIK